MLETHGLESFRELCTRSLADTAKLDAALLDVLGATLDEVQAELDDYPLWSMGQLRQDQACEGAHLQPALESLTVELGCEAEGVEGKRGGQLSNYGILELTEAVPYLFDFTVGEELDVTLELRSCEFEGLAATYYGQQTLHLKPGLNAGVPFVGIPPGVYVLRARVDSAATSPDLAIEIDFHGL